MAHLLDDLREAGTSVLDEMEKAGEVTNDQRRALQYDFISGINSAHLVMADAGAALRSHERSFQDGQVRVKRVGDVRLSVENWLEYVLGPEWRLADISLVQFPPTIQELRVHLVALREALTAKPSEIIEKLPDSDVPKCSRCHQSGHVGPDCPFACKRGYYNG